MKYLGDRSRVQSQNLFMFHIHHIHRVWVDKWSHPGVWKVANPGIMRPIRKVWLEVPFRFVTSGLGVFSLRCQCQLLKVFTPHSCARLLNNVFRAFAMQIQLDLPTFLWLHCLTTQHGHGSQNCAQGSWERPQEPSWGTRRDRCLRGLWLRVTLLSLLKWRITWVPCVL